MKRRLLPVLLFLVSLLAAGQVLAWEGVVVKVLDGDSLQVMRDGRVHELRLYGIDTPEYQQPYGDQAKRFSRELLEQERVAVEEKDLDRYGRIVALVSVQDRLVNRELVRAGLAWHYPQYCRSQPLCRELAVLEQEARAARLGLWADPAPVPPWEWKRRKDPNSAHRRGGARWLDGRW